MKKAILLMFTLLLTLMVACNGIGRDPDESSGTQSTATVSEVTPSPDSSLGRVPDIEGTAESGTEPSKSTSSATGESSSGNSAGNSTGRNTSEGSSSSQQTSTSGTNPPTNSTPPDLPVSSTPSDPPKPVYTKEDYDHIINTVRQYAEGKKTMVFEFDDTIPMDARFHGWHGTPSLTQKGIDGVISTLKYHADLTEQLILGQVGNEFVTITYNITWFEERGEIFFVLIY